MGNVVSMVLALAVAVMGSLQIATAQPVTMLDPSEFSKCSTPPIATVHAKYTDRYKMLASASARSINGVRAKFFDQIGILSY